MRKYIYFLYVGLLIFSCSSEEDIVLEDLAVTISINKPAVYVLEHTDFLFTFNRSVKSYIVLNTSDVQNYLSQSIYSPIRTWDSQTPTETPPPASLIFHFIETKDLSIIVKDALDQLYVFNFQVEVLRGNAVKIKNVKVTNINTLNQINDCAFLNMPSHAGFYFVLNFPQSVLINEQIRYRSSTNSNNNVINWEIENLFIKPNLNFNFIFSHTICFSAYPNMNFNSNLTNQQNTAPQFVNYSFNNYNLNVEIELEWP